MRLAVLSLAMVATCAASCARPPSAMRIDLRLADDVFPGTSSARVILSRADHASFPVPTMDAPGIDGLTVRNFDYFGDGSVDIVIELGPDYPFGPINRFELVPSLESAASLEVRVEVYDPLRNLLAKLPVDAAGRDFVSAALDPGRIVSVDELVPVCVSTCSRPTVVLHPGTTLLPLDAPLSSMVAGSLSSPDRSDLVVGSQAAARLGMATQPSGGQLRVYLGGPTMNPDGDVQIVGAAAGDLLGASLATGDLDGDGRADLIVGAPGVQNGRGAVYLFAASSNWWTAASIDLANVSPARRVLGAATGDRLGEALALVEVDGDGKLAVVAGASGAGGGAGALHVLRPADFDAGGAGGATVGAAVLTGRAGSRLGAVLAATRGTLVAGTPLDGPGAVYVLDVTRDLGAGRQASDQPRWLGDGGGFGSTVALVAVDGDGTTSVAVSAPANGAGAVYLRKVEALTADVTGGRVVRGSPPFALMGAALARVPRPAGDTLILGAPFRLPGAGGAPPNPGDGTIGTRAGAVLVVRGGTVRALDPLFFDAEGQPAAIVAFGTADQDAFGALLAVGDFDGDHRSELVVGAGRARRAYVVRGLDL